MLIYGATIIFRYLNLYVCLFIILSVDINIKNNMKKNPILMYLNCGMYLNLTKIYAIEHVHLNKYIM